MKTTMVFLILQVALALFLCWSTLCRATKTNGDTRTEVRWAMAFEGFASGLLLGAPFLPLLMPRDVHWAPFETPAEVYLVFLVAIVIVQLATAKYWRAGVPEVFQKPVERPASQYGLVGDARNMRGSERQADRDLGSPFMPFVGL